MPAGKFIDQADTVERRRFLSRQLHEGRQEVGKVGGQRAGAPFGDMARPSNHHGNADAALVEVALVTAKRSVGIEELGDGGELRGGFGARSVVGGRKDHGALLQAQLLEGL